jgi:hypothetical protein
MTIWFQKRWWIYYFLSNFDESAVPLQLIDEISDLLLRYLFNFTSQFNLSIKTNKRFNSNCWKVNLIAHTKLFFGKKLLKFTSFFLITFCSLSENNDQSKFEITKSLRYWNFGKKFSYASACWYRSKKSIFLDTYSIWRRIVWYNLYLKK